MLQPAARPDARCAVCKTGTKPVAVYRLGGGKGSAQLLNWYPACLVEVVLEPAYAIQVCLLAVFFLAARRVL